MDEEPDRGLIAARLDLLFRGGQPQGRDRHSLREVANAINEKAGEAIVSPSYLSLLRRGLRTDPSYAVIAAIADFFGVPVDYFLKETAAEPEPAGPETDLAKAIRDSRIAAIALRSDGLSERSLRAILEMVESARALEQIPDEGDTPHPDTHYPS